jgi:hypothetical protein
MSIKNANDTVGNRSRDLPVCIAVPQPLRHRVPPKVGRKEIKKKDRRKNEEKGKKAQKQERNNQGKLVEGKQSKIT